MIKEPSHSKAWYDVKTEDIPISFLTRTLLGNDYDFVGTNEEIRRKIDENHCPTIFAKKLVAFNIQIGSKVLFIEKKMQCIGNVVAISFAFDTIIIKCVGERVPVSLQNVLSVIN